MCKIATEIGCRALRIDTFARLCCTRHALGEVHGPTNGSLRGAEVWIPRGKEVGAIRETGAAPRVCRVDSNLQVT